MQPMNNARRRVLRAILSALAGGGLTATGAGLALPASTAVADTSTGPSTTAEATTPASEGESGQSTTGATTTTTPTSTPPTETTPTTTSTTPAPATTPTTTTPATTTPGTETSAQTTPEPAVEAPKVVLKSQQQASASEPAGTSATTPTAVKHAAKKDAGKRAKAKASGPNGVAASPQAIAAEASALAAILASTEASDESLAFYRIPLFLLPIYKAAAVQYGVPWQVLAAINEVETDYGSDLSVSTAGAVGWMQFMPSTWLQYGVDALNAGYADPYNPVDAIFAAARYLRAAGAATNLREAIFAYNHSEEYVESVLLRAKLISSYPKAVIATLTGLIDGRLPVTGRKLAWTPVPASTAHTASSAEASSSSATAGATAVAPASASGSDVTATPGSTAAPSPTVAAKAATGKSKHTGSALQLVELLSAPNASVVAVQDGRIVHIGHSRRLGKYVVLRDVYGDVFTYAGLGSIAPTYSLPKAHATAAGSAAVRAASTRGPAPSAPASAGTQPTVTLHVTAPTAHSGNAGDEVSVQTAPEEGAPAGMDRARLFAHPGNRDARAARAASAARRKRLSEAGTHLPLRVGSVVASGTVLGRVSMPPGARDGHMRFAVRPAGDTESVNAGPILSNWAQLQRALHPLGAKAADPLLGATASDVFLLSKAQLERAVLADPGVSLDACARSEVAAGAVDKRVLAVLEFLSRSGLEPTVGAMHCASRADAVSASVAPARREQIDITAVNGTPIAGHQGAETITELTIHTLLALPKELVPHEIGSLMSFPGAAATHASARYWNRIHLEFLPQPKTAALNPASAARAAHSAAVGRTAPAPVVSASALSAAQWSQLMVRVGAISEPTLSLKPSSAAIPDPKSR